MGVEGELPPGGGEEPPGAGLVALAGGEVPGTVALPTGEGLAAGGGERGAVLGEAVVVVVAGGLGDAGVAVAGGLGGAGVVVAGGLGGAAGFAGGLAGVVPGSNTPVVPTPPTPVAPFTPGLGGGEGGVWVPTVPVLPAPTLSTSKSLQASCGGMRDQGLQQSRGASVGRGADKAASTR